MKYIKTYEKLNFNYKFNINDIIKIKNGKYKNDIFVIHGFDRDYNYDNKSWVKKYRVVRPENVGKLADHEGFYLWFNEDNIKKAEKHEITAMKYNL